MSYEQIIQSVVVKPKKEPLFFEGATVVELEDEAGGAFVIVSQPGCENNWGRCQKSIGIDVDEWPAIRKAIDEMVERANQYNEDVV